MRESRETGGGRTPPTTQIPDLDSHLRTIILGLEGGGGLENGEKVPWSLPHKTKAALVAKAQAQLDAGPLPLASSLKKTNVNVKECWTPESTTTKRLEGGGSNLRPPGSGLMARVLGAGAPPQSTISLLSWPQRHIPWWSVGAGGGGSGDKASIVSKDEEGGGGGGGVGRKVTGCGGWVDKRTPLTFGLGVLTGVALLLFVLLLPPGDLEIGEEVRGVGGRSGCSCAPLNLPQGLQGLKSANATENGRVNGSSREGGRSPRWIDHGNGTTRPPPLGGGGGGGENKEGGAGRMNSSTPPSSGSDPGTTPTTSGTRGLNKVTTNHPPHPSPKLSWTTTPGSSSRRRGGELYSPTTYSPKVGGKGSSGRWATPPLASPISTPPTSSLTSPPAPEEEEERASESSIGGTSVIWSGLTSTHLWTRESTSTPSPQKEEELGTQFPSSPPMSSTPWLKPSLQSDQGEVAGVTPPPGVVEGTTARNYETTPHPPTEQPLTSSSSSTEQEGEREGSPETKGAEEGRVEEQEIESEGGGAPPPPKKKKKGKGWWARLVEIVKEVVVKVFK